MTEQLPLVYLARHGETEWSLSGKHTGLSDIPLTARGEQNAGRLGERLKSFSFSHVFSSPSQRALRTCELSGFRSRAVVDQDLSEWHYGAYEGKTSAEIHKDRPDWNLFQDGCPEGESVAQAGARADRVIARLRSLTGNTLIFSSGHFLRTLTARWLQLPASEGNRFFLDTAALSILGYEHYLTSSVIRLWNDCRHVV